MQKRQSKGRKEDIGHCNAHGRLILLDFNIQYKRLLLMQEEDLGESTLRRLKDAASATGDPAK